MKNEELLFCPLGGSGEIGANMNLYAYGQKDNLKWIIVDMGVTFADDSIPGIDLIYPDPGFIIDKKDDLLGIVLTHAHEDHIGAVAHIWPSLKCNIYATPFTAVLIQEKFKEKKIDASKYIKMVQLNGKINLGPFEIDFITLTHSILEPNGLSITTPAGVVLHTGDWKIDNKPLIGGNIDEAKLKKIGEKGVMAMICDSTNVFSEGRAGSESDVRDSLLRIMDSKTKKIIVTSFASNVARMETVFYCAKKTERNICLVGRSMLRIYKAARQCGYMQNLIEPLDPREAKKIARDKIIYLCTGSQGEPMGAMNRIVNGIHRDVFLENSDTVIFSSKIIPGNEKKLYQLQNNKSIDVTDDANLFVKAGEKIKIIKGEIDNNKITINSDIKIYSSIKYGLGFDVHRLVPNKKLYLGGIKIPSPFGTLGHSDGDPVLHAVIDAILGACNMGDIGEQFSDKDKKFKNIRSTILLNKIINETKSKGYSINNIDINIITEKPKIQKYKKQIINCIAKICKILPTQINIKGKTTEKLGVIGKEEAIACEVIASVIRYD